MYYLTTEDSFDAAHFLWGYQGKCKNIHGHRWRVVVEVESCDLQNQGQCRGMVVDFGQLKKDLKEEIEAFDHRFLIEKGSLKAITMEALKEEGFSIVELDFRPTAEHLSQYFFQRLKNKGYQVVSIKVYETPNNCASYREDANGKI